MDKELIDMIEKLFEKMDKIENRQDVIEKMLKQQEKSKPQFIETVRFVNNHMSSGSGHCGGDGSGCGHCN
jgi:transcriptional accessory protein Tex/SPT6